MKVKTCKTNPYQDQQMGTSGLRKKTNYVVESENYLENFLQAILRILPRNGNRIVIGGDGRYWNKEVIDLFCRMIYAKAEMEERDFEVFIGWNGFMSTPACSAFIRKENCDLGGIILTASHNPGGPNEDWGIKYNLPNGGPATTLVAEEIFAQSKVITEYYIADADDWKSINLSNPEITKVGRVTFEVVDSRKVYFELLKEIFDFSMIRNFSEKHSNFKFVFDGFSAISGAYAHELFVNQLGLKNADLLNCEPKEDFDGNHPDPNLTYAKDLVDKMLHTESEFQLGCASDGDGDRNMILGQNFFVTPCDSVAVISDYADKCIPYFKGGLKGVARSMPTSSALDRVAKAKNIDCYVVPTGWKFFGNLMDSGKLSICGEESFGTGSDHIREKDGIWAIMSWLSILAYANREQKSGDSLITVAEIVQDHWKRYGRSFYCRYDFEAVESKPAADMMDYLSKLVTDGSLPGKQFGDFIVRSADEFQYTDPIDKSVAKKQGIRIYFTDGSRIVFRLSGTGSVGATIRLYLEQYMPYSEKDKNIIFDGEAKELVSNLYKSSMEISKLAAFTKREKPDVIT